MKMRTKTDSQKNPSFLDTDPHTPTEALLSLSTTSTFNGRRSKKELKFVPSYLPLLHHAIQGEWHKLESLLTNDKEGLKAPISDTKTILHVVVGLGDPEANRFLEKILNRLVSPAEELKLIVDEKGRTVLHEAANAGNVRAAKLLVEKNRELPLVPDKEGFLPISGAALYGHKRMAIYLFGVTPEDAQPCPYTGDSGFDIFISFIDAQFYDLATILVEKYPELAKRINEGEEDEYDQFALGELARTPSAFYSGSRLHVLKRIVYHCIPIISDSSFSYCGGQDIENPTHRDPREHRSCWSTFFRVDNLVWQILWEVIGRLVPYLKTMHDQKMVHRQANQLLKCLCEKLVDLDDEKVIDIIHEAMIVAAEKGIHEIVEEILKKFPFAMWYCDEESHNLFDVAILNRRENVFNLIYQMSGYKYIATHGTDDDSNHTLHLVAKLAPSERLDMIPGAALQMQQEIQWFKEVEKFIKPSFRDERNRDDKTPQMIFSEEHKGLVKEGEIWMKGMANSCITAATLLTTLSFAAAITIPGGNRENDGHPIFSKDEIFIMFVVSNAISLFSSVAAIIMFLSILTSRYAEKDFLYVLPRRLLFGLASLFLSITGMMIAFAGAIHLVLNKQQTWVLIVVGVLAWLPLTLFVTLQFPLLWAIVKSTFGPSMFGKQNNYMLY